MKKYIYLVPRYTQYEIYAENEEDAYGKLMRQEYESSVTADEEPLPSDLEEVEELEEGKYTI